MKTRGQVVAGQPITGQNCRQCHCRKSNSRLSMILLSKREFSPVNTVATISEFEGLKSSLCYRKFTER